MIKDILKDTEQKMQKAVEAVKREFAEVRTGRAHPGLVEGLHIDYYGTPTMLKQLANITVPDTVPVPDTHTARQHPLCPHALRHPPERQERFRPPTPGTGGGAGYRPGEASGRGRRDPSCPGR